MISYFPDVYPDELFYSWICRYYAHSGYTAYIAASEDILSNRNGKVRYEFTATLNEDARNVIYKMTAPQNIVTDHTMYPYYARFAPWDRRKAAFDVLVNGNANVGNLLPIPNSKSERYLMYCPDCAADDRSNYGEAYYHRLHQIRHIGICAKHGCRLQSTGLGIHGNVSPRLFVPEVVIPREFNHNDSEYLPVGAFQQYMADVFCQPVDIDNQVPIGDFLTQKLRGTPYISTVGCMRYIARLHRDLCKAFTNTTYQEHHLQKLFLGYNFDPHLIMMVAYHLGISHQDLCNPVKQQANEPKQPPRTRARSSYSTRAGAQAQEWDKMDKVSLPAVREAIKRLHIDSKGRPRRVTVRAVCDIMGWPNKRLDLLPLCSAEVRRYRETMPQYWAREVVWAYNQLAITNKHINWKAIRDLINIRRKDLHACTPYLIQHTDAANVEIIKKL